MTTEKEINVWIFQCNPKKFNLLNSLRKHSKGRVWTVDQHRREIKKGDIALLWLSGEKAGIYAIADIISDPGLMYALPEDDEDWVKEEDKGKKLLRVKIDITRDISDKPISRKEIKTTKGLENLSITKFAQATNFPVKKSEWEVIRQKFESL